MTTPRGLEADVRCPHCSRVNELHERGPGDTPVPGDWSVCWACEGLAVFTDTQGLRLPNREELDRARNSGELRQVLAAIRQTPNPGAALDRLWGLA